jgi:RHS repeat-associated protein
MAYDPFGVPTGATGTDDLPIGFAGGLADPVTGLVRLGLRDYDPAEGRFTARDPSLFSGSPFNLYSYGGSDPVGRTDPSGLFCVGFSFYAAVGGGISFCHKDGKSSVCAEGGVGAGGGLSVDPLGDAQATATTLHGEISETWGPLGATLGGDLDLDCFNVKGSFSAGTAYGGLNAGIDTDSRTWSYTGQGLQKTDINGVGSRAKGEAASRSSKWGVGTPSGKIALVGCGQF